MKPRIVVSRYWHRPEISVSLLSGHDAPRGGITLETPIEDFILALCAEIRHPAPIFTRNQLADAVAAAADAAIEKIKESSTLAASNGH